MTDAKGIALYADGISHQGPLAVPVSTPPARRAILPGSLDAPKVYGGVDGKLNYDMLVAGNALLDIGCGQWSDAEKTDQLFLNIDDVPYKSYPTDGSDGFKVVSVPGRQFSRDLIPGTERFEGDGKHVVTYLVSYEAGGTDSSLPTEVWVKCSKPGGSRDQSPDKVNEKLIPPTVETTEDSHGQTDSATITVKPYINIAVGDLITASIGGMTFPLAPVTAISVDQTLQLTSADLGRIASGAGIPVSYRVEDTHANRSGYAPYSVAAIWTSDKDGAEEPVLYYPDGEEVGRPGVRRRLDDAPREPIARAAASVFAAAVIELERLGKDDLTLSVYRYAGWTAGEQVTPHLEAIDPSGEAHVLDLPPMTWSTQRSLEFAVPNAWILDQEGCNLRIWYDVDDGAKLSRNNRYLVGELAPVIIAAPVVSLANEGVLEPELIESGWLEITVPPNPYLVPRAHYEVTVKGIDSSGKEIVSTANGQISSNQGSEPLYEYCEQSFIEKLRGRIARFSYRIDPPWPTDGPAKVVRPVYSQELVLAIGEAGAPGRLPAPRVQGLLDGVLSPQTPMLRVTVPVSGASVDGAKVTLRIKPYEDEPPYEFVEGHLTEVVFTERGYPKEHEGARVEVSYMIESPDGSTSSESDTLSFHIGTPLSFGAPGVQGIANGILDPFEVPKTIDVNPAADAGLGVADTWRVRLLDDKNAVLYTSAEQVGNVTPLSVPAKELASRVGKKAKVVYDVTRNGKSFTSAERAFDVAPMPDASDARLPRVMLEHAPDLALDIQALTADEAFTVSPWTWMAEKQTYRIVMKGQKADGGVTELTVAHWRAVTRDDLAAGLAGTASGSLAWFKSLADQSELTIELHVSFSGGDSPTDSYMFRTTVLTVTTAVTLPTPNIDGMISDELDTGALGATATVITDAHPIIKKGLYCWPSIQYRNPGDSLVSLPLSRHQVTDSDVATGLAIEFDTAELTDITSVFHGADVLVGVSIAVDGSTSPINATPFPKRTYTVKRTSAWDVEWDFEGSKESGPVPVLGSIDTGKGMVFTLNKGTANQPGNSIAIETMEHADPGHYGGMGLRIGAPDKVKHANLVEMRFDEAYSRVQFVLTSLDDPVFVVSRDSSHVEIESRRVDGGNVEEALVVTLNKKDNPIKYVTLQATDVIRMDSIKLQR